LAKCASYEAPHYAVFPTLLPFSPSSVQIFSSTPCSQITSVYAVSLMSDTKFHTPGKITALL
jgi:hypothetical protein